MKVVQINRKQHIDKGQHKRLETFIQIFNQIKIHVKFLKNAVK